MAAKIGLFERYGILMFGVGQIIFYAIGLAITYYLSNYKFLLLRPLPIQPTDKNQ